MSNHDKTRRETDEELLEDLRAKHGDEIAEVAYRAITGESPRTSLRGKRPIYSSRGKRPGPHTVQRR